LFCIYLRTNSDLCHLQHKLIGFYNRDEKCLQRGTDWVFKHSGLRFVFKGLNLSDKNPKNFYTGATHIWVSTYDQPFMLNGQLYGESEDLAPAGHQLPTEGQQTATFHGKLADGEIPIKAINLPIRIHLFFSLSQDTLTFQSLAATACTTSLNVKKFYLLPTEYCIFCTCLRKNIKGSLSNCQWLAFIMEETSVYCAVQTGPLNKMDYLSSLVPAATRSKA
jgi:hypothetical protein